MLKEAKRLHDLGFALIWIMPQSKRPVQSGWTTGPRETWKELKESYRPGFNVGVRTGEASQIGKFYLAVIDVDIKDVAYKKEALAALKTLVGDTIMPEVSSGGGNGSRHLYCVTERPFKMITVAKEPKRWEICIYSDGRQMLTPPSIHPSGRAYKWVSPIEGELPLFHVAMPEKKTKEKRAEKESEAIFTIDETCDVRWMPEITDKTRALIEKGIWKGVVVKDRSAYLLLAATKLLRAGCEKDTILSVLTDRSTYLGACAFDHAKTNDRQRAALWLWNYTVKRVMAEHEAKTVFEKVENEEWKKELRRAEGGRVTNTLNNLDLILSNLTGTPLFQKNEFTNREIYACDAPWGIKKGTDLSDIDIVLIKSWLSKSEYKFEPLNQPIEEAMSLLAYRHRTHPVRDWLCSLKWDGKKRIDTWIRNYLQGTAPEPYLSAISRKFLVAMVARVFQPGCQWDYTLILEGRQGTRKSTAARVLASDKWFCDHLPDLKDKDSMLNLQGSWLVELGELKNVKHSDASTVKSYLTRRIDRVRAPYGKRWIDAPRQSVFIGTVNENEYFKDPTGNRRFWPVAVGECDVASLAKDRDQLFAEAKAVFDKGEEELFLTGKALTQAFEAQDDRRVDDDESEMRQALLEYMEVSREERNVYLAKFKMKELFTAPGAPWCKWSDKAYSVQNGAQALRNLGFERTKSNGQRIWRQRKASDRGIPQDFF